MRLRVVAYNFDGSKSADFMEMTNHTADAFVKDGNDGVAYFAPGAGIHYIYESYFPGADIQRCVSLAYQYLIGNARYQVCDENNDNNDAEKEISVKYESSLGIVSALGIEFGFAPDAGVFTECAYGYNPADVWGKKRNLDGFSIFYGMTPGTSYVD